MQGTLAVATEHLKAADNAGARSYDFQLNGEILIGKKLFDAFRYKFNIPIGPTAGADAAAPTPPTLPLVFERFLRPGKYTLILKLEDLNGGEYAPTTDRPGNRSPRRCASRAGTPSAPP